VAEGCLVYLTLEEAKKLVKGHCIFDVFTLNRKQKLGSLQRWLYDPVEWDFDVLQSWVYDREDPEREALVLEVEA